MPWDLTGNANTNETINFLGTTDNHSLAIKTNNKEALHVDTAGHVGIGTVSPGERLTVGGGSLADTKVEVNAGGDQYAALRIKNSQGSWNWQVVPSADSPGGRLRLGDETTGREWLAITHAGNVGIGTVSPTERLTVGGGSLADTKIEVNAGGDQYAALRIKNSQGSWNWQVVPSADSPGGRLRLGDETTGREWLAITHAGNVGIGTVSPSAKLEVTSAGGQPAGHFENDSGNTAAAGVEVSSNGPAGVGVSAENTTDSGAGVVGSGFIGVRGICTHAQSLATNGFGVGVHGAQATDPSGTLLAGTAGWFDGDVFISRNLKVVGDLSNFTIDHPLDPANKYLNHRYVESSERKNIYDGIVSLNEQGEADVLLPAWFDALNQDFRYQLTCVGGYGPVYVAKEIKSGAFKIAGGKPGMKVSWQVTGVRHDPWAKQNPILIEEDKPADEKGYYLNAEAYNQPREKSIGWLKGPARIYPLKSERA